MITNLKIAIRYSVLISLLMMLWLCIEFMIGLQDKYVELLIYSALLSLSIPFFGVWRALKEKLDVQDSELSFQQAFVTAFMVIVFASFLAIAVDIIFTEFVNPDYFEGLIKYYVHKAFAAGIDTGKARMVAAQYFNLQFSIVESFLAMLVFGTIAALYWSWRFSSRNTVVETS